MKSFLTFLFLFITVAAYTCSCSGAKDFCTTVSDSITVDDYTILGRKFDNVEHGMKVEILKTYRGEIEDQSIIIWGDLGWLCREYTSQFAIGDTFVFDVFKIGTGIVHPSEGSNDFGLSFCGLHFLKVKNGNVTGFINQSDGVQNVDLETFDSFFEKNDCASIRSNVSDLETTVFPNPFMDEVLIRSNQRISELELYDMTGRLILTDTADRFIYRLDLSDFRFTSGMYILRIVGYFSNEKIVKIVKV